MQSVETDFVLLARNSLQGELLQEVQDFREKIKEKSHRGCFLFSLSSFSPVSVPLRGVVMKVVPDVDPFPKSEVFQSPCGEVVMKESAKAAAGFFAIVGGFQSPCGEVVMKGEHYLRQCSRRMLVSVPLRGSGDERGIQGFENQVWVGMQFQSPCGEVVMKGLPAEKISGRGFQGANFTQVKLANN